MKRVKVQISDDSDPSAVINDLERAIPEATKRSAEFALLYPQATACIEDFAAKAKKLASSGTTIHIQKEFTLPDVNILVALDYPRKAGFLDRLRRVLKRA